MGKMYFPDEIDNFKKEKSKNWFRRIYDWYFAQSLTNIFIVILILIVLELIFFAIF